MRAALVLAVVLLGTPSAASADDAGVGVVVTGDSSIQPQLAAQIEDWLRQRGHQLVAAPLRPDELGTLIDCFVIADLVCARKVVEREAASPRLMFAQAELTTTSAGARDITITGYWFQRGEAPMAARRTCGACTDKTMHATIEDMMVSLAGTARVDVGTVEIRSTPAGATITIDGKPAGRTPSGASIPVGDHIIEVSADGYIADRRAVTVKGGAASILELALEKQRSTKLPLVVAGAGAAVLATGIVLFATSEEDTGEKPEYRDTRAGGVALSVVGVAAISVGVYLYLRGGSTPDSAPAVAVGRDGAYLGWVRAF